jgi:sn-1 stearoyl-lipid 9-desaturase
VLVGMAGPFGMTRTHDLRDWAQRQKQCHDYFAHRRSFWHDAWWQLHCEVRLDHPPVFTPEARIAQSRVYRFMESTWMLQQLPVALLLFAIGGWAWVVWGICARVAVCVTGHWLVGHFAHREGHQDYVVDGAGVQGHNVGLWGLNGLFTMGECWHNNHHAFPGSAKLGLHTGQADPGFSILCMLEGVGLVRNIRLPEHLPHRPQVRALPSTTGLRTPHGA